jgi:threonine dehydrogenase-like Zn-dependent dehydrogenase
MRAAVFYGSGDVRIIEREAPRVGPKDRLLRMAAAGGSGVDIKTVVRP